MAKTLSPSADATLYDDDFYMWTQRQAELLREARFAELDLPHLVEEVEDLGANQRREVFSRAQQIIRHLLKLQYSTAGEPRQGWRQTVRDQRDELDLVLTPSLRRELGSSLRARYERARRRALQDLSDHGELRREVPDTCPYSLDQILDAEWLPQANSEGENQPG